MEAIIGLCFLFAIWLTLLTMKLRNQKRTIDTLKKNNKIYLRELLMLGYGKEKNKEGKTGEAK